MLISKCKDTASLANQIGGDCFDLAILFGGKSSEYSVSLVSAAFIIEVCSSIPNFRVAKIGITSEGGWYLTDADIEHIKNDRWQLSDNKSLTWCLDGKRKGFMADGTFYPVDCVFPVLHGKNGEDGTVQGLLQLAGIPYVGCRVADSAVSMDKVLSRMLFDKAGIPQTKWTWLRHKRYLNKPEQSICEIEAAVSYPVFVKPANAGSSVGISKACDRQELRKALSIAFKHDCKVVIDEAKKVREIEFAVLQFGDEDETIFVSEPGEIRPEREFYDFEAKYKDANSRLILPAPITKEQQLQLEEYAKLAFRTVDAHGLCRADFFIEAESENLYINEINTLPGFTGISMYPKLMELSGLSAVSLMQHLISSAIEE